MGEKNTKRAWEIDAIISVNGIKVKASVFLASPEDGEYEDDDLICTAKYEDAVLIAAAPDLLEALKGRERDIGTLVAQIRWLEEVLGESLESEDAALVRQIETDGCALAAIAKAEG